MCTSFLGALDIPVIDIAQRVAADPTPFWNILDLTPGRRGSDWDPKLDYR